MIAVLRGSGGISLGKINHRHGLRAASAFLIATGLFGSGSAAYANTVYLTCTLDTGPPSFRRYITVDYDANNVITSDLNVTTPYGTTQQVQITDSQISWQVVGSARANGLYYAEHYTLNRLSGALSYYDDGTQHGEAWTCAPGEKPVPKF